MTDYDYDENGNKLYPKPLCTYADHSYPAYSIKQYHDLHDLWQACAESKQEKIKQAYIQGSNDCHDALVNSGALRILPSLKEFKERIK